MLLAVLALLSMQQAGPPSAAETTATFAAVRAGSESDAEAMAKMFEAGWAKSRAEGYVPPPLDCATAATTPDINECAGRDLQREQARMERYLAAARTRTRDLDEASESDRQRSHLEVYLQTSQKAWEAYAAIVCDGVYDQWKGGTIRNAMYLGCQTEMTRERTRVIWRDYLTYADSTPPILPEPVDSATDAPTITE